MQRIAPGYRSTEEYLGNIAYAYGNEAAVETTPLPLHLEQEVLPVLAPASVPAVQGEIVIPADEITTPKVAEPDDEVAADYDTGILLFKRKQYVRAREKLDRVVQVAPGYKSTSEYLSRIDSLLQEEQQRQLEEQQQALARAIRKEKKAKKVVPPEVVQQTVSEAQKPEPEGMAAVPVEVSAKEDLGRELHVKRRNCSRRRSGYTCPSNSFPPGRSFWKSKVWCRDINQPGNIWIGSTGTCLRNRKRPGVRNKSKRGKPPVASRRKEWRRK